MNHPNAFLDALLLVIQRFNRIYKLGQAGLYGNPIMKIVYRAFRIVPIYRQRDGNDAKERNELIFKKAIQHLDKNSVILIYAEGNPSIEFGLKPLKKGAVRLAFQAQSELNKPIQIVPLGVTYGNRSGFRTDAVLSFGKAILTDRNESGKPEEVNRLTGAVETELKKQLPVSNRAQEDLRAFNAIKKTNHLNKEMSLAEQHAALRSAAEGVDREDVALDSEKPFPSYISAFVHKTDWLAVILCAAPGLIGLVLFAPLLKAMTYLGVKVPKDPQFSASLKVATLFVGVIPMTFLLAGLAYFIDGLTYGTAYLLLVVCFFASLPLYDAWTDFRSERFFSK